MARSLRPSRTRVRSPHRAIAIGLALGLLLAGSWAAPARGDGGTLRLKERQGSYDIALFTAPTPFVAGPVDISVLVLDAASGEPAQNAKVSVAVAPLGQTSGAVRHPATTDAATNKLLHAAVFDLPRAGSWAVEVAIDGLHGPAKVRCTLETAAAPPSWMALWPWIAWPAPVIVLYGIHQRLVWRKTQPLSR